MNIGIVSYSKTGRNQKVAQLLAEKMNVKQINISTEKEKTILSIILDFIFNRTPKVIPSVESLNEFDHIIFLCPIWMGEIATPLRQYLKSIRKSKKHFSFITLSGGADGRNENIEENLIKFTKQKPEFLLDYYVRDLLPQEPQPTKEQTQSYPMNEKEYQEIVNLIYKEISSQNLQ